MKKTTILNDYIATQGPANDYIATRKRTDVGPGRHSFAHHTRATASVVPPFGARWKSDFD